MSHSGYVTLDNCRVMRETDNAFLIHIDEVGQHWIPKSQISPEDVDSCVVGETGLSISITEWIADQKGIG